MCFLQVLMDISCRTRGKFKDLHKVVELIVKYFLYICLYIVVISQPEDQTAVETR